MSTERLPMLIGGHAWAPADGEWMQTVDPSTGDVIAEVPVGTAADVDYAVSAGKTAQREWMNLDPRDRSHALRELARRVEGAADELSVLDARDAGIPISAMHNEIRMGCYFLEYFSGLNLELRGDTIPATVGNLHYTIREPIGVVGRIIPYNHPLMFACEKIAAPLAAGNSVILKPAQQAPLTALRVAELARDVLPDGLLNVVTGGASTGVAVVTHPDIRRVAFTGSVNSGRAVMKAAADQMKEITLELGGKNPLIVYPDFNLDSAIDAAVAGMNFRISAGQSCGSTSRVLVDAARVDAFVAGLAERVESIRIGSAVDPRTEMGPLITREHQQRVLEAIESAVAVGAELIVGGGRPEVSTLDGGFYVSPTILRGVDPGAAVAQEEIFGPVVVVFPWSNVDEVIDLANAVKYGLTANILTNDLRLAHSTAASLDAGFIWINGDGSHYVGVPFGGYKASGIGREESLDELMSYSRTKSVNVLLS